MIVWSLILAAGIYSGLAILLSWSWHRQSSISYSSYRPPLSVIISAHNEADNLPALLKDLCHQSYQNTEIIIVLDRCTDESQEILENWIAQYPQIRYLSISQTAEGWASKKWALTQGIDLAQHEWLVLTDADCRMGSNWLKEIAASLQEDHDLYLGISMYQVAPGILNLLIRFETWYTAFQYIGWAGLGMVYMGVGRNLVYRKSLFQANRGFEAFKDRLSGDDDLLVNAYARPKKTGTIIRREGQTVSIPKRDWTAWFRQKTRHVSASNAYNWKSKFILGIFHVSHLWFYLGILLSLLSGLANPWIWWIYSLRIGLCWALFGLVNRQLKEPNLLLFFPVLDLLFFLYNLSIVPIGIIKAPTWTK